MEGIAREGSHGIIWETVAAMDYMLTHLETSAKEVAHEHDSYYRVGIDLDHTKAKEYYRQSDRTPVYRAAIVLHPGLKWAYFERNWADYASWIKNARKAVKAFWQREKGYYEPKIAPKVNLVPTERRSSRWRPGDCFSPPPVSVPPKDDDEFDFDAFLNPSDKGTRKVEDEYEQYCHFPADPAIKNPHPLVARTCPYLPGA